jgi:E3 ubiquitin-protein ligase SHPRH
MNLGGCTTIREQERHATAPYRTAQHNTATYMAQHAQQAHGVQYAIEPGTVAAADIAALASPVSFSCDDDNAEIMPNLINLINHKSTISVVDIPLIDETDLQSIEDLMGSSAELRLSAPVELRAMKPVASGNYMTMHAKVKTNIKINTNTNTNTNTKPRGNGKVNTKTHTPNKPIFKLCFSQHYFPLVSIIHSFLKSSKNAHSNAFYTVPFHMRDIVLRLDMHSQPPKLSLSFQFCYAIYIEGCIYPQLGVDTLKNLNALMELITAPKLTDYQWSNNQFYAPPTVSSFYSMITENTARNFNDPESKPLKVSQIDKTLMPFQVDSLKWMLNQEGKRLKANNTIINGNGYEYSDDDEDRVVVENCLYPQSPNSGELSLILDTITPGWRRIEFTNGSSKDDDSEEEHWFNPYNGALCTTTSVKQFLKSINYEKYPAKGFLCEEMGLGKTLEITSLIKLNPRSSVSEELIEDTLDPSRKIRECKTTLILCPETIINQWNDEIKNTCPDLNVCIYQGIAHLEALDESITPTSVASMLSSYDVVLTSYNLLGREVDRATFIPTSRPKRKSAGYDRIDYSSPLMLLQFHRLVLDEAQLASLSISRVAHFARIIPRVHTWCVSGTLIRKDLNDLQCLIKSQRMYPLDLLNVQQWSELPRYFFDRLFKRICLRHTKEMVGTQVNLPKQSRIMLRSPFSTIENDNYQDLFNRFLAQVGLNEIGEPIGEGFDYERSKSGMRSWSSKLRMACCHALLNGTQIRRNLQLDLSNGNSNGNENVMGTSATRREKKNSDLIIGTLDDVLMDLINNNEQDSITTFTTYIKNYTRLGKINEFLRNPTESVTIFNAVIGEIQRKLEYYRGLSDDGKSSDKALRVRGLLEYLHQAYFMLASAHYQHYRPMRPLPDNFTDLVELTNKEGNEGEEEDENKAVDIETLTEEEKKNYDLENEYYAKADEVLNQLLEEPLKKSADMITKLKSAFAKYERYQVEKIPELNSNIIELDRESSTEVDVKVENETNTITDATESTPIELPLISEYFEDHTTLFETHTTTLSVSFILERAKESMMQLNEQSTIINHWFQKLYEYQIIPVTKDDTKETTGEEYKSHLLLQEHNQAYIDQLQLILDDREKGINSTEDTLSYKSNSLKSARTQRDVDLIADERIKNSSLGGSSEVYEHLEQLRKFYIPQGTLNPRYSLHTSILELIGELQSFRQESVEYQQMNQLVQLLKKEMKEQLQNVKHMKSKLFDLFNDTFNSKVSYFKSLQIRSDALVNYFPEKLGASPRYAAMVEIEELKRELETDRSKLRGLNARMNYLRSLNSTRDDSNIATTNQTGDSDNLRDDSCVICRFRILVGTLTPCGHKYCRECLGEWMKTKSVCPLCQKKLRSDELYNFTYSRGGLKGDVVESLHDNKEEIHTVKGNNGEGEDDNADDDDQTLDQERLKLLQNRRIFEKDMDFVYQGLPTADLRQISSIRLKRSYGTKVDMIIRQAKFLVAKEPGAQILIFSQWNNFLLLLGRAMKHEDVTFRSWMDQKIALSAKDKRSGVGKKLNQDIVDFKKDNSISCFLLNTVAQAAGLTFTNASHVFLCEPIVNLSFELQAINRIHRIGQTKETKVWNFIIEGTIEESIAYLGTKKRIQAARVRRSGEVKQENGESREKLEEIDENVLEAKELTKVSDVDKKEGEVISDDDLWAAFFAAKSAKVIENVYS